MTPVLALTSENELTSLSVTSVGQAGVLVTRSTEAPPPASIVEPLSASTTEAIKLHTLDGRTVTLVELQGTFNNPAFCSQPEALGGFVVNRHPHDSEYMVWHSTDGAQRRFVPFAE